MAGILINLAMKNDFSSKNSDIQLNILVKL
jgi:hypothetical protein